MSMGGILLESGAVVSLHLDFAGADGADEVFVLVVDEVTVGVLVTVVVVVVAVVDVDVDVAEDCKSILIIPSFGLLMGLGAEDD